MTQKDSSSTLPDGQQSLDASAEKTKKTKPAARKAPAKAKAASETAAPAKKTTAKTEPRAGTKTAAKDEAAPEAKSAVKKTAKTPTRASKTKTGGKTANKTEAPVPAASDGAEKPKTAGARRAATPKTAATEKKDAPAKSAKQESIPEIPAAEPKTEEKPPRAARQTRKKPEAAASGKPKTAQAETKTPDSKPAKTGETKTPEPAKPVTAGIPKPATSETPESAAEAPARETAGASSSAQAQGQDQDAPPKPSRRSRRGGRRRNKNRNANGAVQTAETAAAPSAADTERTDADPAKESAKKPGVEPAVSADENASSVEKKADTQAQSGESGKNGGKQAPRKDGGKRDSGNSGSKAKSDVKSGDAKSEDGKKGKEQPAKGSKRKMFISVLSGELVEVVLAEEGQVVEYYVEMQHQAKVKGNIYKGVVSNIDANLQAAFISYAGGVKNGFLQIDEVHPEYYLSHHEPAKGRKFPPIQKVLKPGQEILVQVVKEPSGTKGAFLTSYLSLPGRFLVLTPGREQIGVSRKVDSDEERTRLRGMLEGLTPGKDLGVIVRTVSEGASKTSLQRDLQFLKRLWKDVRTKGQTQSAPSLVYEELDLSTRAVRDYLTDDVQEVWVDDASTAGQVTELASLLFPKKQNLVQVPSDNGQTLFERFSLQKQLDQIHSREVALPSGGRLVIDNTEALTAIDINSGRSSGKSNFEDMAFRTNLEAARAIPLQLRLRDIGGQVVADFIEMRDRDHWREVEKAVRNGMKGDRARYDVGKIGPFGLLEIVRQRLGSSAISVSTEPCPCCKGTGIRRNMEWQSMQCLREISRQLRHAAANNLPTLTYEAVPELAFHILNAKRTILRSMEEEAGVHVIIRPAE